MKKFLVKNQLVLIIGVFISTVAIVIFLNVLTRQFISPVNTVAPKSSQNLQAPQRQGTNPVVASADKYMIAEAAILGATDNISYYFKDFTTGDQSTLQPTRSWIPASVIKAYVAVEAFRQARLGLIDFNQSVTIQAGNVVANELETEEFPRLREGTNVTIRQLVEVMVIQSDNIAYNTLLDILDRRSINNTLHDLGLTESVVGQKLNLDDSQLGEDSTVPGYQINTTTAKDFATLFDLLYSRQIPGSDEILAIFKRQKINTMIPAFLPHDVPVAHKTGDWAPIFHDGGIVYKPDDPFVLVIFSNSGKPEDVANLARVAYFRNAESVGVTPVPKPQASSDYPSIYLADSESSKVLASEAQTQDKFPSVTASDLGITQKDLTIDGQDAIKIRPALITPKSPLYGVKRSWEKIQYFFAVTPDQKANTLLNQSVARLSEAKALYGKGETVLAEQVLNQSQSSLASGANLAKDSKSKDRILAKTKVVSDLQFATLGTASLNIPSSSKEQFVDTVYGLYKKQQETVLPITKTSAISNPTAQTPAIATVEKVEKDKITVKSDNGQTKEVLVNDLTPIREFHSETMVSSNDINVGQRIAIIGQTDNAGHVIPQFILNKLPQELPNRIQGTVLEINPKDNTIKIQDKNGIQTIVEATRDTIVRSTQTTISLEGIRAGSQVTIFTTELLPSPFGNIATPPSSASLSTALPSFPQGTQTTTAGGSAAPKNTIVPSQTSLSQPTTVSSRQTPVQPQTDKTTLPNIVRAITVTITKNSSGKEEQKIKKEPASKPASPPATPANKK